MNAVAYARFSSNNQTEKSIEAQVREISAYASLAGYNLVKIYADRAKSGYMTDRPEFQQMIRDSSTGLFDIVLVHKFDRFGRDGDDAAYFERQLKLQGVRLISVEENLDERTPEGALLKRLIFGINEFYGKNLAREVMKGLKTNAFKCLHTGGIPPLGYDVRPDKTYSINEREAEAIRLIFKMYSHGSGYTDIINALTTAGHKTKIGRNFGKNSLHDILKNEKYKGTFVFNKTQSKDIQGKFNRHKYKSDDEIIRVEDGIPAIVSALLWNEVQAIMKQNQHKSARAKAKVDYLLSGKVFCGLCGGAMTGETRRYRDKEYSYYVCNNGKRTKECNKKPIPKQDLEQAVIERITQKVFNPQLVDSIASNIFITYQSGDAKKQAEQIRLDIAGMDRKINNITNAISDGVYASEMKEKLNQLSEEKRELNMKLFELESVPEGRGITIEQIKADLRKGFNIDALSPENQKIILQGLIHKVFVYDTPDKDKWKIRVVITPTNPTQKMLDFLDMTGKAPSPPQNPQLLDCGLVKAESP